MPSVVTIDANPAGDQNDHHYYNYSVMSITAIHVYTWSTGGK